MYGNIYNALRKKIVKRRDNVTRKLAVFGGSMKITL